jgi:hypothetical protein
MFEKAVGATQSNEREPVGLRLKICGDEVVPEVPDGLLTLIIFCADFEVFLDLSGQSALLSDRVLCQDYQVIRVPTPIFGLGRNLDDHAIVQNGRHTF